MRYGSRWLGAIVRYAVGLVGLLVLLVWTVPAAHAQASGTFVSGVSGDDANPCSRTAPCQTLQGTIPKTAAGGEIRVLDAGSFGSVTITKAISILAVEGVIAEVTGNGITINAGLNDTVVLRGLTFNLMNMGSGNGIKFLAGRALTVKDTRFQGAAADAILFTPNRSAILTLENVVIDSSVGAAVRTTSALETSYVTVLSSTFTNNSFGIHAGPNARVAVFNSVINSNTTAGLFASGANAVMDVSGATLDRNAVAVSVENTAVIRLADSLLSRNTVAFANTGGSIASWGHIVMLDNDSPGADSVDGISRI